MGQQGQMGKGMRQQQMRPDPRMNPGMAPMTGQGNPKMAGMKRGPQDSTQQLAEPCMKSSNAWEAGDSEASTQSSDGRQSSTFQVDRNQLHTDHHQSGSVHMSAFGQVPRSSTPFAPSKNFPAASASHAPMPTAMTDTTAGGSSAPDPTLAEVPTDVLQTLAMGKTAHAAKCAKVIALA